jgi:SPP1 family predicted phage head-tail adaptor
MIDQAGQLDRRITIQQPINAAGNVSATVDSFGQRVDADSAVLEGEDCIVIDINDLGGIGGDLYGQQVRTFSTLATVWSNVTEKVGSEAENGDMISSTKKVEFIIRYRADVTEEMRIIYNNNIYKIETIQNADARKAFLKVVCSWSDAQ